MAPINYAFEPISLTPPRVEDGPLVIAFRLPPGKSARNPIAPATALQVSIGHVFLERQTARDVEPRENAEGEFVLRQGGLPKITCLEHSGHNDVDVTVHAWKGEKWLGSWEVGRLGSKYV